ncbi:unnamed protein product [Arabis nemorensis]|uniref:Uncharacterized protein n=1 Tax=Arabis nemorensis TaxID=586526 RepID=A0A565BH30_9BRAS|nr:unnamed protein product [Arabis nemorensis]
MNMDKGKNIAFQGEVQAQNKSKEKTDHEYGGEVRIVSNSNHMELMALPPSAAHVEGTAMKKIMTPTKDVNIPSSELFCDGNNTDFITNNQVQDTEGGPCNKTMENKQDRESTVRSGNRDNKRSKSWSRQSRGRKAQAQKALKRIEGDLEKEEELSLKGRGRSII